MSYYNSDNSFKHEVEQAATNRWLDIFNHFGIHIHANKHESCPLCGGEDRFRYDNKNGRGDYFCNGCGAGDGFNLVKNFTHKDFWQTLLAVGSYLGLKPAFNKNEKTEKPLAPQVGVWAEYWCPNNVGKEGKKEYMKLCPKYVWPWCPGWWLVRHEWTTPEGEHKKIVFQVRLDPEKGLTIDTYGDNRPLVGNLENETVLIVEGEKTMNAAIELVPPGWSVVTWVGGCGATHLTNWTSLKGKTVYIWPDNDEQGKLALQEVAMRIKMFAQKVYGINAPKDKPLKWDLADALYIDFWDKHLFKQYVDVYSYEINTIIDTSNEVDLLRRMVKPLGTYDKQVVLMPSTSQSILKFSCSELTEKTLKFMLKESVWNSSFRKQDNSTNWNAAIDWILGSCQDIGPYNPRQIRGRGAWYDAGRTILHTGDKLIVDSVSVNLIDIESKYIYERGPKVPIDLISPLTIDDLKKLHDVCTSFNWEHDIYGEILFGWILLAPICGALDWRPHCWLTGKAGAGKTTILDVLMFCLDGIAIGAEGGSTEAGIRQVLKSDAWPIIFDEAESESKIQRELMERNLALVRQSSSNVQTKIIKGSASNEAVITELRSMFFFSSIDVALTKQPDKDRVSVLHLTKSNDLVQWKSLEKKIKELKRIENFSSKLLSFCYKALETVKTNAQVFSDKLAETYDKRFGDQHGTMLAAAALVEGITKYNSEEVAAWLGAFDLQPFTHVLEISQEFNLLDQLMQSIVQVTLNDQSQRITIGALIQKRVDINDTRIADGELDEQLAMYGIKVIDKLVYFAHNSKQITTLLKDYASENWDNLLSRIDGAVRTEQPIYFGSGLGARRAIGIPFEIFL